MPVVLGVKAVKAALTARANSVRDLETTCVVVGYTAAYALWVHEAVEMKLRGLPRRGSGKGFYWDPQGQAQAKFLETPARLYADDMAKIVRNAMEKRQTTLLQALGLAGEYLQGKSMELVPVDTGNLKGSAFTREEPIEGAE